jgi:uncharacterized protein YoxC
MSTGDWFTLQPLNINNYQPQIDDLNSRLTTLTQRVDNMQINLELLQDQANMIGAAVDNMRTQLTNLNNTVTTLNNTVNSFSTSINNILDQYKPIMGFTQALMNFTDQSGNTTTGNFHGAWYRPIKLLPSNISDDGVDLKFTFLVMRAINIGPMSSGVWYFSDNMNLPLPFVNNNDFRVYWTSSVNNHYMHTRQAYYELIQVPVNGWKLAVQLKSGSSIVNDSAWFIFGYI